jgi:hypothetical protein
MKKLRRYLVQWLCGNDMVVVANVGIKGTIVMPHDKHAVVKGVKHIPGEEL